MRSWLFLLLSSLYACGGGPSGGTEPIFFLEKIAPDSEASVEFRDETRRALTSEVGRRFELDVTFPEAPVLRFAFGASSKDRPTLLAPVVFRVWIDETEVFREVVRRSQGETWFPRSVELSRWSGKSARVRLETTLGEGGVPEAEGHVVAAWGNPVLSSLEATPKKPSLVLVSIDCLRADHVGIYGYPRETTPNLDAFAEDAVIFEDATATSSYTLPTHASMLTGLPPSLHGATARRRISGSVDYLPKLLAREGYRVQGVVSAPFLSSIYGFDEGFHTYRLSSERAAVLVDQALALLDEGGGMSHFLFLHLFDVHAPYSPPGEFLDRFGARPADVTEMHARIERRAPPESQAQIDEVKNLYDAEVAYVDRELGRFFDGLRERGLYESSLIVVTADHGEAFFEHGHWEHSRPWRDDGHRLYQEVLHVPLIVKWPDATEGKKVEAPVSQAAIFATFLETAGVEAASPWAGSLSRHREGGGSTDESRFALSEFLATPIGGGASLEVALRRGNLKYVASFRADSIEDLYRSPARDEALFDLAADPMESRDRAASGEGDIEEIRAFLRDYLAAALSNRRGSEEEDVSLDPELLRKLESLGYLER